MQTNKRGREVVPIAVLLRSLVTSSAMKRFSSNIMRIASNKNTAVLLVVLDYMATDRKDLLLWVTLLQIANALLAPGPEDRR